MDSRANQRLTPRVRSPKRRTAKEAFGKLVLYENDHPNLVPWRRADHRWLTPGQLETLQLRGVVERVGYQGGIGSYRLVRPFRAEAVS